MDQGIELIHEELFELLVAFDKICSTCGVNYSLHGGTLIGAKRYGDFIPWDDDADVTMMSWDYIKISEYLSKHPETGFRIAEGDGISYRFQRTKLEGRPMCWVDVIEYNYLSENKFAQKIRNAILIVLYAMCQSKEHVKTATAKKHGYAKLVIYRALYYIGYIVGKKNALKAHIYIRRNWLQGSRKLIQRTNDVVRALRRIMPVSYYSTYERTNMHGYDFLITRNYHEVLAQVYGENWLTPPKKEDQVPHENIVRDVYHSIQSEYEKNSK